MSFEPAKYPTLALASTVQELRLLPKESLPKLCDELRQYLLDSVSRSSGHFASGLGVVELTVALHYVYNTPFDHLVWDVGHQAYPHKILTGRRDRIGTIRQKMACILSRGAMKVNMTCLTSATRPPPSAPVSVWLWPPGKKEKIAVPPVSLAMVRSPRAWRSKR